MSLPTQGIRVYAVFDAEMYEIFDEENRLIHSECEYMDVLSWCEENGNELISVQGLD